MKRSSAQNERQNALVRMIAGAGLMPVGVALYLLLRGMHTLCAPLRSVKPGPRLQLPNWAKQSIRGAPA